MNENQNIEDFFKRKLDQQKFEFNEAMWDKLEERLDSDPVLGASVGVKKNNNSTLLGGASIIIIALILGYWFISNNEDLSIFNTRINNTSLTESQLVIADSMTVSEENTIPNLSVDNNLSLNKNIIQQVKGQSNASARNVIIKSSTSNIQIIETVYNDSGFNTTILKSDFSNETITYPNEYTEIDPIGLNHSLPNLNNYDSLTLIENPSLNKDEKSTWSFSLFVAPDFNGTNFDNLYESLSNSIGFTFDYQPKPKLRIGSGVVLNRKIYSALAEEYNPPYGAWNTGNRPDLINAECLVMDIPLNVGFRVFNKPRRSVWINTGISNYWMLTEDYQYKYDTPPGQNAASGWQGRRESFHFAGAINLSIAIEHRFSRSFAVAAEPYFKVPIQGIGYGSVNLVSSGIKIGLRYLK